MHCVKRIKAVSATAGEKKRRMQESGLSLTNFVAHSSMSFLQMHNCVDTLVQHENDTNTGNKKFAPIHINSNLGNKVQFTRIIGPI